MDPTMVISFSNYNPALYLYKHIKQNMRKIYHSLNLVLFICCINFLNVLAEPKDLTKSKSSVKVQPIEYVHRYTETNANCLQDVYDKLTESHY